VLAVGSALFFRVWSTASKAPSQSPVG
jgi:hypothetical protein